MLERAEPVARLLLVEERQVADLARGAGRTAVDLAAEQHAAADADPDLHEERIVDLLRGAAPALGQERQPHLVVHQDRAGEGRLEPGAELDSLPAGKLRRERHASRAGVDHTGRPDTHRLEALGGDARGQKGLGRCVLDQLEQGIRLAPPPLRREHLTRQIRDQHQHLVRADVDPEHVPQPARKAQQPRPPPRPPRGGLTVLAHVALLHQQLDGGVDRRLREARGPGEIRAGDRAVRPYGMEHCRRVEPTEETGGAGWQTLRH